MTTDNVTPPERCPICGEYIERATAAGPVYFNCGIIWHKLWLGKCDNATRAALRVGATLLPSPLETARDALVAALDAYHKAFHDWLNNTSPGYNQELDIKRSTANDTMLKHMTPTWPRCRRR